MTEIILSLTDALRDRLDRIAHERDLSFEQCIEEALLDYLENWEDFRRTLHSLDQGEEERTVLRAANE